MIKLLTFSTLYPNSCQHRHGIFVENRLKHLLQSGEVKSTVVAPVPWFPFKSKKFGRYAIYNQVPKFENRYGIDIYHPRYPVIPKFGMNVSPDLLYQFSRKTMHKLIEKYGDIDIIDAHYFYPDGVAAVKLGRLLDKPVVITARGNDISLIPNFANPRRQILNAASEAAASITVCKALKNHMGSLGADPEKIVVLRNGVDLERFYPMDRELVRHKFGLDQPTLLSVGHLIERKGHHLVIEAMKNLKHMKLLIAGDGEEEQNLKAQVKRLGLERQISFLGAVHQEKLNEYYSAVDALILASSREGWANVLLEAMACGTPVVATSIWGTPEVVAAPEAGVLMGNRSANSIVESVSKLFESLPLRQATRQYAEKFSWDATSQGQIDLFKKVIANA